MLIGANGQLGSDIVKVFQVKKDQYELVLLTHADIEIADPQSVNNALDVHHPDVVITTAAFHKLEECERQVEKTFAINAYAVRNLALACQARDKVLAFISTDYVFGGDWNRTRPYTESDPAAPINVYGVSKLAGESFVRYVLKKYFILRVSGLYGVSGSSGKGGNFVELMLRLAHEGKDIRVVNDQTLTPSYTMDVARQIEHLLKTTSYGLYHSTCQGQCSWYEFAAEIFRLSGLRPNLSPSITPTAGAMVIRPRYSVLDNVCLRQQGLDLMRPWQESLAAYLQERCLCGKI